MDRREFIKAIGLVVAAPAGIACVSQGGGTGAIAKPPSRLAVGEFVADGGSVNINIGFVPDCIVVTGSRAQSGNNSWIRGIANKDQPCKSLKPILGGMHIDADIMRDGQSIRWYALRQKHG